MARLFAIGDIHGCLDPLNLLLDRIRPTKADTVVTLGDYVDRGPDSKGVIDRLLDLSQSCNLVSLMGNHEQMMLSARRDRQAAREWQTFGGLEALESYGGGLDAIPEEHWQFLIDALPYYETKTHIFVHGALFADIDMQEQPRSKLLWGRFKEIEAHISGKTVVCGHTPQISGRPANKGYAICIDTDACRGGWLSCLDIETGIVHQADIDGEYRELDIDDFLER